MSEASSSSQIPPGLPGWRRADCLGCGKVVSAARPPWVVIAGSQDGSHLLAYPTGPERSIATFDPYEPPPDIFILGVAHEGCREQDPQWEAQGIFEHITKPRITAAITGLTHEDKPISGDYVFGDEFALAEGLRENAIFFELQYLDPNVVSRGKAFEAIAPLLWLRSGAEGPQITRIEKPFAMPEGGRYAVLFDVAKWHPFVEGLASDFDFRHAYIVTDSLAQFQQIASELPPTVQASMLYEDFLHNFELGAGVTR